MKRYLLVVLLAAVMIFCLYGCASELDPQTLTDYASAQITISGLAEEDFTVSVADLSGLEQITRQASAQRANGQTVSIEAVGPLLDTWLAAYGTRQADFSRIRFSAADGYSIAVSEEVLKNREIILALADAGQALPVEDRPLRVVIPGERAMYWVRQLNQISFERGAVAQRASRLVLLEAAAQTLPALAYEYYGAQDQAVSVRDLFEAFGGVRGDGTEIRLLAADGLEKTETEANFLTGMIKYTGADSPRFVSDLLPVGMHTHSLVWIGYDETLFLSLPLLIRLMTEDGQFYFSELLRFADVADAKAYQFHWPQADITYTVAELAQACFSLDSTGQVLFHLQPGDTGQAGLQTIQVVAQ